MAERRQRSELTDVQLAQFRIARAAIPEDADKARAYLAGVVASWHLPTPAELLEHPATKDRATPQEMAERRAATWWLMTNHGKPLSCRGVAYRAEALLGLPKTEQAFRYIQEATLDLRDSRLIDYGAIRDGRRTTLYHGRWPSLDEMLCAQADTFELDLWSDAPVQAMVWIEKTDLGAAIHPKAQALGVDVHPASGFTGASYLFKGIADLKDDGRPLVIFELMDKDSSGERMVEAMERRIEKFCAQLDLEIDAFTRVALTREQIAVNQIPTRPQKDSTHRRPDDDPDAAELDAVDALYPGLLDQWLEDAVDQVWPAAERAKALQQEEQHRAEVADVAANWEIAVKAVRRKRTR
jgi:hypothetical protein